MSAASKPEPDYQPHPRLAMFDSSGVAVWGPFQFAFFHDNEGAIRFGWAWFVGRTDMDQYFAIGSHLESEAACKAVLRRWWDLIIDTADTVNLWKILQMEGE